MRFLVLAGLLLAAIWMIRRSMRPAPPRPAESTDTAKLVQDPICKTYVPIDSAIQVNKGGQTHYFCSDRCAAAFQQTPD